MKLLTKVEITVPAIILLAVIAGGLWFFMQSRSTQQIIDEANEALQAKDWQKASELFAEAYQRDPENPDTVFGLTKAQIEIALRQKRSNNAGYRSILREVQQRLPQLIQKAGDLSETYVLKGNTLFYLGKYKDALEAFRQALKRGRQNPEAHLGIGKCLYAMAEEDPSLFPEAQASLVQAIQIRSNLEEAHRLLAEIYLRQGDVDAAAAHANTLEKLGGRLAGETIHTLGKVFFFKNNYQKARNLFLDARRKLSNVINLEALIENNYFLGTTCFYLGDMEGAASHLRQSVTSSKTESFPLVQLAQFQTYRARMEPDSQKTIRTLQRAADALQEAQRRSPQDPIISFLLAMAYLRLERLGEARTALEKVITLVPDNTIFRFELANILLRLGEDGPAISHYEQILQDTPGFAEAAYNLGSIYLSRAGYEEAIRYLELAASSRPQFTEAHLNLAQAYAGVNQFEHAREQYESILDTDSEEIQAYIGLGMIYQKMGDLSNAEKHFQHAIEIAPSSEKARQSLASIYLNQGNSSAAIRHLEKVTDDDPQNYAALIDLANAYLETGLRGNQEKAKAIFESLSNNPIRAVVRDALSGLAMIELKQGNFDAARERFDEVLDLPGLSRGEQAQVHLNIGNAFLKQDQEQLARKSYQKAIDLDGTLAEAHYNIARLDQLDGQLGDARRRYMMAYSFNPRLAPAHFNMGVLYEQRRDMNQAEREYETAIELDPARSEAYLNLANLHFRQEEVDKATERLLEAKKLNPNSSLVRDALASLYFHQGQYEQARAELNYPNLSAQGLLLRGMLNFRNEAYSEAVSDFQNALLQERAKPRPETLINLSAALIEIGNYPEAERYLNQARGIRPESTEVLNNLAALHINTGRYELAMENLRKSLEIQPDQPEANELLAQIETLE
jgi:tetratricopeptide (TPR) repeat protein